jgi:NTP pyrophosphatase (non-canonical NTP hydrolase)
MDEQERVAEFLAEIDAEADPAYRILDLAAEVGEIAADATKSTGWGADPGAVEVGTDELGDALFALLATAEALEVDAGEALEASLSKYRRRIEETGSASSGECTGRQNRS